MAFVSEQVLVIEDDEIIWLPSGRQFNNKKMRSKYPLFKIYQNTLFKVKQNSYSYFPILYISYKLLKTPHIISLFTVGTALPNTTMFQRALFNREIAEHRERTQVTKLKITT